MDSDCDDGNGPCGSETRARGVRVVIGIGGIYMISSERVAARFAARDALELELPQLSGFIVAR